MYSENLRVGSNTNYMEEGTDSKHSTAANVFEQVIHNVQRRTLYRRTPTCQTALYLLAKRHDLTQKMCPRENTANINSRITACTLI